MSHDVQLETLEVLTPSERLTRLTAGRVGRVGFIVSGRPQVLPVNYAVDEDGTVVFRTTASPIEKTPARVRAPSACGYE